MKNIQPGLDFVEQLVFTKTGDSLSDVQRVVLRASWQGSRKTYDQIAQEFGYSASYIKQIVAPKLWKTISEAIGEKVSKNNFRAVIERRRLNQSSSTSQKLITKLRQRLELHHSESSLSNPEDIKYKSKVVINTEQDLENDTQIILNLDLNTPQINLNPEENKLDQQPLAKLELPEGKVPINSHFYVERFPGEKKCYQGIVQPGSFIHIKAPRQMGKSSLLTRILCHADQQNYHSVLLNLQQVDKSILSNLDKFLRWFAYNATRQLKLTPKLDDYWHQDLGSKASCTIYFQEYLLSQIDSPLVIAVDEVNEIFEHADVAADFLPLLRSWYEETKDNLIWQKLRLVIVNSTEVYLPLNINQSPFTVGLPIRLRCFNWEEIKDLSQRHQLHLGTEDLAQLMWLVAGHPYLIRVAFYHIAQQELTLEELIQTAASDTGIYSRHLQQHWWCLQQNPQLASAFDQVLQAKAPVELGKVEAFKLNSMGLVNIRDHYAMTSCHLYQRYFDEHK